ncbi:hypothetical protein [Parabacteroides distasonis]|uniref:hypothetical protein n=1 Tax=Parabacteroides distasonis TaxID=823 RepID=UPI003709B36F
MNATDKSIENILSQALRNTSLKYSIEGRNISMYLIKTLLPNRLRNASPVSLKTRKETLLSVLT